MHWLKNQRSYMEASLCQPVAAAAGEVAKDTQYQYIMSADGHFIPLVCETFGVWTSYMPYLF